MKKPMDGRGQQLVFQKLYLMHILRPPLSFSRGNGGCVIIAFKKISPGIYLAKKLFFGEWDWNQTLSRAGDYPNLLHYVEIL